ncbi:MAG: mechanosensitive ion channel domain-containing protein [Candidatus Omnitrophota bacterium]
MLEELRSRKRKLIFGVFILFIICQFVLISKITAFAQEEVKEQAQAPAPKEDVKVLEAKEKEAVAVIEQKKAEVKKVQAEAEAVTLEKQAIENETLIKKEVAEVKKQEAELLKKEADITKDTTLVKEAKKLKQEAKLLEQEAMVHEEKLKVVENKEELVKKKLEQQQAQIEALKKNLQDIKFDKAGQRGFVENSLRAVPIFLIGVVVFMLLRFSLRLFERSLNKKEAIREDEVVLRMRTVSKLINWLGSIVIFVFVIYFILENFGFSVAPLLAGAGIAGLAFGFGGQYLIRDIINGLFILIEDQYRINDVVKIGDNGGLVEDINLRITTLRDLAGRVIIIPNGEIKTVINYTKGYAQALLDIGVAYKENVDRVIEVIKEIGKAMRSDPHYSRLILDNLEMLGVDDFADSAVVIKFRIKTLPIKQWEVMREFRRRLKNRFDELGIEIPFPHRTLYWGSGEGNEFLGKINKSPADSIKG